MKLIVEIAKEKHELTLQRDAHDPSRVTAVIDGRNYELTAHEIAAGNYSLLADNRVFQCRVDKGGEYSGTVEVYVNGKAYAVTVVDPKRMRAGQGSGAEALNGTAQIVAPMPGKIVGVLIEEGASVEAGEGLVIVEAMKMQNEMKAPRAGVVKTLRAVAGATVNAGDVLAVIE
ncbi:MAG: biotin/lipoyl-containing protein [Pyrinomonadaceae bacterium]